jgi:tetratricopeptide (TPR) repeat protein
MSNTSTTQTNLPDWVTGPAKTGMTDIQSWLKSPDNYVYGSKPGESLYTPLSDSQNQAIGNTNWMADQDLRKLLGLDEAQGMFEQYGNAGPNLVAGDLTNHTAQGLGTERVVDENGFLGKISDYMNPYLEGVLDPTIKKMRDQEAFDKNDIGASAMMSGAFGDARHGVETSMLRDNTNENVGDVTGKTYSDAFMQAMGLRSNDIARKTGLDVTRAGFADNDVNRIQRQKEFNAGARDKALDRKERAGLDIEDVGQKYFKNFKDANDALFNAGKVQRDAGEEKRKAIQDFQTAIKDKRYNDAIKLLGAVQGSPQPTTSTTKNSSSDGIWGLIASMAGAAL